MKRNDPNIAILELAARGLGPLTDKVVFLGGCATGLLTTATAAPPARETKDVDVIVEIASRHDYLFSPGNYMVGAFTKIRAKVAYL